MTLLAKPYFISTDEGKLLIWRFCIYAMMALCGAPVAK
jgi:hypothetical protein